MPLHARRTRASAMVLVVSLLVVLLALALSFLDNTQAQAQRSHAVVERHGAWFVAQAGLWATAHQLNQRSDDPLAPWTLAGDLTTGASPQTHVDRDGDGRFQEDPSDDDDDGLVEFSHDLGFLLRGTGYFEVRTLPLTDGTVLAAVRGVDGASLRTIRCVLSARRNADARSWFSTGLTALGDLWAQGPVFTDGFDSRLNPYGATPQLADLDGRPIRGADGGLSGSVRVRGDARLQSDVYIAGDLSLDGDQRGVGDVTVAGAVASFGDDAFELPDWTIPTGAGLNPDAGVDPGDPLHLNGGTLELGPGTYVFDSLHLSGSATLQFTGTPDDVVDVYLTSDDADSVKLLGNSVLAIGDHTASGSPRVRIWTHGGIFLNAPDARLNMQPSGEPAAASNLVITSDYRGRNDNALALSVQNRTRISATFALPHADAEIRPDAEVFGALVADDIALFSGSSFHYDHALDEVLDPATQGHPTDFHPTSLTEVP